LGKRATKRVCSRTAAILRSTAGSWLYSTGLAPYRTRLPPWVLDDEALLRIRVKDAGRRQPPCGNLRHSLPLRCCFIALPYKIHVVLTDHGIRGPLSATLQQTACK